MSQANGVSSAPSFFWNPEKQTTTSLGLRIAAVILGIILITGSILNLCGVTGLNQFHTSVGWTCLSVGFFVMVMAGMMKCIQKKEHTFSESPGWMERNLNNSKLVFEREPGKQTIKRYFIGNKQVGGLLALDDYMQFPRVPCLTDQMESQIPVIAIVKEIKSELHIEEDLKEYLQRLYNGQLKRLPILGLPIENNEDQIKIFKNQIRFLLLRDITSISVEQLIQLTAQEIDIIQFRLLEIELQPAQARPANKNWSNFDRTMMHLESLRRLSGQQIVNELDNNLSDESKNNFDKKLLGLLSISQIEDIFSFYALQKNIPSSFLEELVSCLLPINTCYAQKRTTRNISILSSENLRCYKEQFSGTYFDLLTDDQKNLLS